MINKDLIKLALNFRNTELWKVLTEDDLFVVSLPDNETAYVNILGNSDEFLGITIYVGAEQLNSYYLIKSVKPGSSEHILQDVMRAQSCLQVMYVAPDEIADEIYSACEEVAFSEGMNLGGDFDYPVFITYLPDTEMFESDESTAYIYESVLKILLYISDHIGEMKKLGFHTDSSAAPLFSISDGLPVYNGITELPEYVRPAYPEVIFNEDPSRSLLNDIPAKGTWLVRLVSLATSLPVGDYYKFPKTLFIIDTGMNSRIPIGPVLDYVSDPEQLLFIFYSMMASREFKPREIKVNDTRTHLLLKDFCKKAGIKLTKQKRPLEKLLDALENYYDYYTDQENFDFPDSEDTEEILDRIMGELEYIRYDAPDEFIAEMPSEIKNIIHNMISNIELPKDLSRVLLRRLNLSTYLQ